MNKSISYIILLIAFPFYFTAVSYTHLDVYKRQKIFFINEIRLYNETESAPILAKQINARSTDCLLYTSKSFSAISPVFRGYSREFP